jgi:hypothetical protein
MKVPFNGTGTAIRTFQILYVPFVRFSILKCNRKGDLFSVPDPGCLSRIPDPDFYPSRIPDPGSRIPDPKTATKERGEKKLVVIPFYVATNFTKLKMILVLTC